ncbi:MAG: hypothetical protein AAF741_05995 [Bacteroidota bacterium]
MKNSKLFALLTALSKEQLQTLADFAQSPYFNKQEDIGLLARYIANNRSKEVPGPEACWSLLYPTKAFDSKAWSYLASGLLRLAEDFIAFEDMQSNKAEWQLRRLKASSNRNLDKSYRRQVKQFEKLMQSESSVIPGRQRLWHDYLRLEVDRSNRMGSRKPQPVLQGMLDALEADYLAHKWRIGCEMLNHQALLNSEFDFGWPGPEGDYSKLPSGGRADLFRQAYLMLQNPDETDHLTPFIANLQAQAIQLDQTTKTTLFQLAANHCARQIRAGKREFLQKLLDLYRIGLEESYLLVDGQLAPLNYKNIVKLGLGLREFDWVQSIIERYTDLLPDENRQDAYHYSMADLHYFRREYDEALTHLRNTEFSDLSYALGARAMLIKIYYELDEDDPLHALFSSFYIYLLRNKQITKATKDAYLDFIKFTKRLDRSKSREALQKLRTRVEQSRSLNARSWLLERIDDRIANK